MGLFLRIFFDISGQYRSE